MTVGSLFSGIGGFDLGFHSAGFKTIWMCEKDKHCQKLLHRSFPRTPVFSDVRDLLRMDLTGAFKPISVPDVIIGGDPCPAHSNAKGNKQSKHPDLSGYFLAVVARFTPQWVVRENVPTSVTDNWFATSLVALGYSVVIVCINATSFVPQNRQREFVVGCSSPTALQKFSKGFDNSKTRIGSMQTRHVFACLTTKFRHSCMDNYVYEENGLRPLEPEECEYIAGFPAGYTVSFPDKIRVKMCGNAVVPKVAEQIGVNILRASKNTRFPSIDIEHSVRRFKSRFFI